MGNIAQVRVSYAGGGFEATPNQQPNVSQCRSVWYMNIGKNRSVDPRDCVPFGARSFISHRMLYALRLSLS